jgi:hypothetical protein
MTSYCLLCGTTGGYRKLYGSDYIIFYPSTASPESVRPTLLVRSFLGAPAG